MTDIVNPEYAVERLKILAEDICKVKEDAHVCDCRIYYFGSEFRQSTPLTFLGRNATLVTLVIGLLCSETESKDKMTMKRKTERINCDNANAASAALVRVLSRRSCHGRAACPHASRNGVISYERA